MQGSQFAAAVLAAVMLAGCGGRGDDRPEFNSLVSFGDSLSDVGSYAVGTVRSLGGGKYTINGPDSRIWIELIAARLGVPAPCAAQTGLEGENALGFDVPVTNHSGCTAYAQGGARVTEPVGPGNKASGGAGAVLGALTVPVVTQIQNHLARTGNFSDQQAVFVLAGGNDVFVNLDAAAASGDTTGAVAAMGAAGSQLASHVRNLVLGRGAKYVAVVNLPDVGITPFAQAQDASVRTLINAMVTSFNTQLRQGLAGSDAVLVDAYAASREQAGNPSRYGISNATTPACDLSVEKNPLRSSLTCNRSNVVGGNVENYLYADEIHPAPYGHGLLADVVAAALEKEDWL